MLKFAAALCLVFPLGVYAGTTDTQAFFLGTAKTYNLNLNEKTWLKKLALKTTPEELKAITEGLSSTKEEVLLSAVTKDKNSLAFVDIEGKTLARLTTNEAGKLFLNSQALELEGLNGITAQYDYLKSANLGDLQGPARAQVEMSLLKFYLNFKMGLPGKTITQLQGDTNPDTLLMKELITPFEVKRLDHSCRLYEGETPSFLRKKYGVGAKSEMAQKDGAYAVRSMTLHLLDEYEETYEERLDVVFKAKPQVVFTKASKSKKKSARKSAEVSVYDIWHNGQQIRKNILANEAPTTTPEMSRARSLLTCCGKTTLTGNTLETDEVSCLDRLQMKASPPASHAPATEKAAPSIEKSEVSNSIKTAPTGDTIPESDSDSL